MAERTRRQLGAWYTPPELVQRVVEAAITDEFVNRVGDRPIRVVDPACGDGRFLIAAASRIAALGGSSELVGVDVDPATIDAVRSNETFSGNVVAINDDALTHDWRDAAPFDLVIGNPPFLSQMAATTTRGGASGRGGGPYADAAVEFLALAAELVDHDGGRVALVLPQSLLAARDAGPVRRRIDASAVMRWSWWAGEREFDAHVLTCALVFEFGAPSGADRSGSTWSHVVTQRRNVPSVPAVMTQQGAGTLGDRVRLNANFRDEYYGMVPAVGDHAEGPQLITSGLIDPGHCLWGDRPITFAKRRFDRPRLDLSTLNPKMTRWASDRLVPKVLIANQTKIIEAIADVEATMLPGVPVVAAYPVTGTDVERTVWEVAAVLSSPVASAWAWQQSAGTGLSADAIRLGPVMLAGLPWPAGDLADAIVAFRNRDLPACARNVHAAYGLTDDEFLATWWYTALERIEARR